MDAPVTIAQQDTQQGQTTYAASSGSKTQGPKSLETAQVRRHDRRQSIVAATSVSIILSWTAYA